MSDIFKSELNSLNELLSKHGSLSRVQMEVRDSRIEFTFKENGSDKIDWTFFQTVFSDHFKAKFGYTITFNAPEDEVTFAHNDLDIISWDGPEEKVPPQPIVIYSTKKNDCRLLRFNPYFDTPCTKDYYAPDEHISDREINNLEQAFNFAYEDLEAKRFVRNIIELNINCLSENKLKDKYIPVLRKLPNHLRNRFAISLVRIPKTIKINQLKQAALICKVCTDNIFVSLTYNNIINQEILDRVYGLSGCIVTIPDEFMHDINDIKDVYHTLNKTLTNGKSFVVFNQKASDNLLYKSKSITALYKEQTIECKV